MLSFVRKDLEGFMLFQVYVVHVVPIAIGMVHFVLEVTQYEHNTLKFLSPGHQASNQHVNIFVYIYNKSLTVNRLEENITILKGIHPGFFLERVLKKRKLPKRRLAAIIGEYPQQLGDITKGKRRITPSLSIRLGKALGFEESFFSVLQTYYDIKQEKIKQSPDFRPDLTKFRPVLFWDTDINSIDWKKSKSRILKRIFERGNEHEIKAVIEFYDEKDVQNFLHNQNKLNPDVIKKVESFLSS